MMAVSSVAPVGRRRAGELAIVLHTHMPYVEGFGTRDPLPPAPTTCPT